MSSDQGAPLIIHLDDGWKNEIQGKVIFRLHSVCDFFSEFKSWSLYSLTLGQHSHFNRLYPHLNTFWSMEQKERADCFRMKVECIQFSLGTIITIIATVVVIIILLASSITILYIMS